MDSHSLNEHFSFEPASKLHYQGVGALVDSPEELYLFYPSGTYPFDEVQLATLAQQRHDLTVVLMQGEVVAFANLYDVEPDKAAFIGNVVISKSLRGIGLGKKLTRYMMQVCREKYRAQPHLSVFAFNQKAINLYEGLGFEVYGREDRLNLTQEKVELLHMRLANEAY